MTYFTKKNVGTAFSVVALLAVGTVLGGCGSAKAPSVSKTTSSAPPLSSVSVPASTSVVISLSAVPNVTATQTATWMTTYSGTLDSGSAGTAASSNLGGAAFTFALSQTTVSGKNYVQAAFNAASGEASFNNLLLSPAQAYDANLETTVMSFTSPATTIPSISSSPVVVVFDVQINSDGSLNTSGVFDLNIYDTVTSATQISDSVDNINSSAP